MTYEELMQFLSGAQTMPWTREDYNAGAFNPNSQSGAWTGTADPMWSGLQGSEAFYQPGLGYEGTPSLNRDAMWQYLNDNGMSWNVGQKGNETVNYIQGPDGKPIADTANYTRADDDRFKLAALAAMGVTGANIGLANGMFGGAEAAGGANSANPSLYSAADMGTGAYGVGGESTVGSLFPELMTPGTAGGVPAMAMPAEAAAIPGLLSGIPTTEAIMAGMPALANAAGGASGAANAAKSLTGNPLLDSALKVALPVAGAIGGAKPSGGETITRESKMDPEMQKVVYGSYLPELQSWYQANKTPNANQRAGWDKQLGLLNDPALSQQLGTMRSNAFGMMNAPVAGNPFASGQATLGTNPFALKRGLLGGG